MIALVYITFVWLDKYPNFDRLIDEKVNTFKHQYWEEQIKLDESEDNGKRD